MCKLCTTLCAHIQIYCTFWRTHAPTVRSADFIKAQRRWDLSGEFALHLTFSMLIIKCVVFWQSAVHWLGIPFKCLHLSDEKIKATSTLHFCFKMHNFCIFFNAVWPCFSLKTQGLHLYVDRKKEVHLDILNNPQVEPSTIRGGRIANRLILGIS